MATKFRAWLLIDMVCVVLPARLAEFELRSPEKQKDKTLSRWSVYECDHADFQHLSDVLTKYSRHTTDRIITGISEPGSMTETSESIHGQ